LTQTKRTSNRRKAGELSAQGTPDPSSAGRRFTPTLNRVTEGGSIYGNLVAFERAKHGLSQKQLAAKIRTSPATIGRIEQGHPPGAELHRRLTKTLGIETRNGVVRRLATVVPERTSRLRRPRRPRRTRHRTINSGWLSSRWLWGGVAIASVALAWLVGGQLSTGDGGASASQPSVRVSSALGAPAVARARLHARVEARIAAEAKARRAAQKARERKAAAAAAAAAAARRAKAQAKATNQASSPNTQTVTPPVTSSPPPSSSTGSSGGGGSSGPAPSLGHGIGSG
jgi:ribosome-binding protein aMBF1 (putative translation factor)